MATYYWVGGAGTWDPSTTTRWAASSGGAGGAGVPTIADNVIIDSASGTGTITCSSGVCADLTVTATQAITCGAGTLLAVYGNFALPTGGSFTWTNAATLTFAATTTGKTINCGGRNLGATIFNGVGGGWTLTGAFSASANTVTLTNGSLNTAGFSVTVSTLNISNTNTRSLTLGASTVNISSTWSATISVGLTFSAGTSTINLTSVSPGVFNGGSLTYNNVAYTSTSLTSATINGSNTFANLSFASRASVGVSVVSVSSSQTITGTLTVSAPTTLGSSRYYIQSSTFGTSVTLTGNTASITDVDFRDITHSGTTWTGTRLGDCGGNSGITFDTAKTVYWNLAGTNNVSATGWATTSTGVPAAANFPLAQDTATFTDVAPSSGSVITFNASYNFGTIDFSTRTVALTLTSSIALSIYGSTTLSTAITPGGSATWTYLGRGSTQTITSAGRTWTQSLTINNIGGTVRLSDACVRTQGVTHSYGTLDLNNFNLTSTTFSSSVSNTRTIAFGSGGSITLTSTGTIWSTVVTTNLTVTGSDPNVFVTNSGATPISVSSGVGVGTSSVISFYFTAGTYSLTLNSMSCNNLLFVGFNGSLVNSPRSIYGDLVIDPGMTLAAGGSITTFAATTTGKSIVTNGITVDFPITFDGIGGSWILQNALSLGSSRAFRMVNGTVDLNGFSCSIGTFSTGAGTKNLTFNGSTLTVLGSGAGAFLNGTGGLTTTAGTGTGTIAMSSASAKTFSGGGITYNCTLRQGGAGALTIADNNTFNNITNSVTPTTVTFTQGTTQTFTNFNLNGTAGNLVTINSSTAGTQATLSKSSGTVNVNYLSIQDSNATGGATWNANNTSTNVSNNTGWSFGGTAFTATQIETMSFNDFSTQAVAFLQSLAENFGSADSSVQVSSFLQAQTEDTGIADISLASQGFYFTQADGISAGDGATLGSYYNLSLTEGYSVAEDILISSVYALSLTEPTTSGDSISISASFVTSHEEDLAPAESSTQQSSFSQSFVESVDIADVISTATGTSRSIIESLTAGDVRSAVANLVASRAENLTTLSVQSASKQVTATRTENLGSSDTAATISAYKITTREPITIADTPHEHGWSTVVNSQSGTWNNVNDSQSSIWTTIDNTQVSGWTTIDDSQ